MGSLGSRGFLLHDIGVSRLQSQAYGRELLCHDIYPENLRRQQRDGITKGDCKKDCSQLCKADGQKIGCAFSDVVIDPSALFNCADNGGEVVIGDDHIRCFFRNLGACFSHSHANIGGLQSRSIIDSVSRHGYNMASFFQRLYYADLVLCRNPRKHRYFIDSVR